MAGAAPQRLMQDVMPPYSPAAAPAVAQPDQSPTQPQAPETFPHQAPIVSEASASLPVSGAAEPVTAPHPMFPVHAEAPGPAASASQTDEPALNMQPIAPTPQTLAPYKPKTNWLVIGLAVVVSAGLAVAAYMAFKGA